MPSLGSNQIPMLFYTSQSSADIQLTLECSTISIHEINELNSSFLGDNLINRDFKHRRCNSNFETYFVKKLIYSIVKQYTKLGALRLWSRIASSALHALSKWLLLLRPVLSCLIDWNQQWIKSYINRNDWLEIPLKCRFTFFATFFNDTTCYYLLLYRTILQLADFL